MSATELANVTENVLSILALNDPQVVFNNTATSWLNVRSSCPYAMQSFGLDGIAFYVVIACCLTLPEVCCNLLAPPLSKIKVL